MFLQIVSITADNRKCVNDKAHDADGDTLQNKIFICLFSFTWKKNISQSNVKVICLQMAEIALNNETLC